ncbi:MAG: prepilin-type N-terminal cleavage/methylation domain-containing protein [Clostridiales bacterium]|nr:prepilin-type N-terminal cleavage/methylation domain-containing protein [Clostridiales bacterium]
MRRISKKNKKGFTLLEMMLSIAIIVMISGLLVTLIVCIKDSFMTVFNQNDSADYAMLFARGFEQSFLGKVVNETSDPSYEYHVGVNGAGSYRLFCNSHSVFDTAQSRTQNGTVEKWEIKMGYKWDDSRNMVLYKVYVWDNYYNPGKLAYIYEGGFMIPHFSDQIGEITVSGSNIVSGDTDYKDHIKFKPA